jgi:glycosyltransferase involved in cell wall biosynthesis
MTPMINHNRSVWLVVPAFNEAKVIGKVVETLVTLFPNVVVVDDGSVDSTAEEAATHGALVVQHPINLGQGAALQTGIDFCLKHHPNFIVTFDADGQHNLGDVLNMLDVAIKENCDVVLGSRFLGQTISMPATRRVLLRVAIWFTRATTGLALTDTHNGLRVFTAAAAEKINISHNGMAHASEILEQIARLRLRYVEAPMTVTYTPYSLQKGQRASNAVSILIDLVFDRLKK